MATIKRNPVDAIQLCVTADRVTRIDLGPFAIAVRSLTPAGHGLLDALVTIMLHRGLVFGHGFEPEADLVHRIALFVEPVLVDAAPAVVFGELDQSRSGEAIGAAELEVLRLALNFDRR